MENGSKHLRFYTLHNQEHAVTLIKVAVRWIHALSLFNLKRSDYFILFAACYLHDISMVTLPDYAGFYTDTDTKPNQILTSVESALREGNTIRSQQALLSAYQEIDAYLKAAFAAAMHETVPRRFEDSESWTSFLQIPESLSHVYPRRMAMVCWMFMEQKRRVNRN